MMMSSEKKIEFTLQGRDTPVTAAVSEQAGSQASTSNDRSASRVALLAPGASSASREAGRAFLKPPTLLVDDRPPSRSPSLTSLASVASEKSVYSNATAVDIASCNEDRERSIALRKEEEELIQKIRKQVEEMLKACEKQTNVSMVIKDGLKNVRGWLEAAHDKHAEADKSDKEFDKGLQFTEEGRKERRRVREGIQVRQIRKVVLESQKRKKENSPPAKDRQKKQKTGGTFAEKAKEAKAPDPKTSGPTTVPKTRVKRPKQTKQTVLIKVAEGQTYASVLSKLRKEVKPELCESEVVGARPTEKGDVLLTLGGSANQKIFAEKVAEAVEGMATVQSRDDQKITLEIRDLDSLTEEKEVVEALERVLMTPKENRSVRLLEANKRGIKLAVVIATRREAAILERLGHVKVGFVSCCVRKRVAVIRCHRCLGFGHKARQCSGVDRSSACFKCGESGHNAAGCRKKQSRCFLCSETEGVAHDHVAGSGKCAVFRKALEAAKHEEALRRR